MRIILDFDDVIVPTLEECLKVHGKGLTVQDIKEWTLPPDITSCFKDIDFDNIVCKNESIKYINELLDLDVELFVATASHPTTFIKKYNWIINNIPKFNTRNIALVSNKSILRADIIVDDGVHNLETSICNRKFLYSMPHNESENRFERIHSLKELVEIVKREIL